MAVGFVSVWGSDQGVVPGPGTCPTAAAPWTLSLGSHGSGDLGWLGGAVLAPLWATSRTSDQDRVVLEGRGLHSRCLGRRFSSALRGSATEPHRDGTCALVALCMYFN